MRHLIEICLMAGEWLEDNRGKAAAGWARKEPETKTIGTFLSQGAVGGAVGHFLVVVAFALTLPIDWSVVYILSLPMFLAFGAMLGSIAGFIIWLASVVLKRRMNFVARSAIVACVLVTLSVAQFHLTKGSPTEQWSLAWILGSIFLLKLPIVLMTGSRIRPGRLLLLGAGPRNPHYHLGDCLSVPAGFLLRVASVFGLLEGLLALAFWMSSGWVVGSNLTRGGFAAIALVVLYFGASSYLSIRTSRKGFLLPTIFLLNLPLVGLIVHVRALDTPVGYVLYYFMLAPICLWVVYTLGRLIAPEPARHVASWTGARLQTLPTTGAHQVQA